MAVPILGQQREKDHPGVSHETLERTSTNWLLQPLDAVDLHLHTYASDGGWSPAELIRKLKDMDIQVAAVCDHDTQDSVLEAIALGEAAGVTVVPGVEVTVTWDNRQWHLLVYGIRPDSKRPEDRPFLDLLNAQDTRIRNFAVDARRRVEASGRPIPGVEAECGALPLKPVHILRAMIAAKHVPSLKEAAELVVELGGKFTDDSPLGEVVEAAQEGGGVCVLAHPGRADLGPALDDATLDRMLAEVKVDGLEAHYRSYTDADTERYRAMAASRGLLIGAGSDSHAPGVPVDPRPWRAAWPRTLLRALGFEVLPGHDGEDWLAGMDTLAAKPAPGPTTDGAEESTPAFSGN